MKLTYSLALMAGVIATHSFAAETVTVTPSPTPTGQAQGPAPFTYRGTTGRRTQQVYSSSFFAGTQSLTSLAFRATPGFLNGADYGNVLINLSTTSFGDESGTPLGSNFAGNVGANVQSVYSGALSFAAPTTNGFEYIVNFSNPFLYDPTKGNLLLDVTIPTGTAVGGPGFFLASFDTANQVNDGVFSVNSVFDGSATSGFANTAGTITQFTGTAVLNAVPEPASWAMLIGGFGVIGGGMRRRVRAGARFA